VNTNIKIALDWVPNMLHAGLLYANVMGWFQEANISVQIMSPEIDDYCLPNDQKLLFKHADIAILPPECVFENNETNKEKLVPFANILQDNTSAIITLKSSGINRPADLGAMRYGAIEIPYEVNIVRSLLKADGCDSPPFVICPERLSVWNQLLDGKIDAVWAYSTIEGIEAELKGVPINVFKFEDFNIPYPAVPLIATTKTWRNDNPHTIARIYTILNRGYQACYENPEEVAQVLANAGLHHYTNDYTFNLNCLNAMKPHLLDINNQWGLLNYRKLESFRSWLIYQNLIGYESEPIPVTDLF
jgi:NitT/TauT family transport system substrate-binding protein